MVPYQPVFVEQQYNRNDERRRKSLFGKEFKQMMMVNENWGWATFGQCGRKMKSSVLKDDMTGGEKGEKLK